MITCPWLADQCFFISALLYNQETRICIVCMINWCMACVSVDVPTAQLKKCDWWLGLVHMRGVLRCCTIVLGGLCVMIVEVCRMPHLSVVNWVMAWLCLHLGLPSMEEEVVQFGKMTALQ